MKKFFSLIAAVLFAGSMFAATEMTCAQAREAALSVANNNDLYNNGEEIEVTGFVTSIQTTWSSQYKNISFWMADEAGNEKVLQAYRCVCENEADAPAVGDQVKVTGNLTKYNTTPEFAAGCTCVILEKGTPEVRPVFGVLEVADAIAKVAAGELIDGDTLSIHGIITKLEFKGKNFAKYGSVNIYVADANGEAGEFEFYNCYSLEADTFRTSVPEYDAESTQWAQFNAVIDGNEVMVSVGDEVTARGTFKLFNTTYELNTGCFLTQIGSAEEAIDNTVVESKAVKVVRDGQLFIMKGENVYNAFGTQLK